MPRPRFEKLDKEKKARILEEAAKEFAHHGFDDASLNHILAAAGVSKGAAYYYFDDKADLFVTVAHHVWANDVQGETFPSDRLTARDFWPQIEALYRRLFVRTRQRPWLPGLTKAIWKLPHQARERGPMARLFAVTHGWLGAILAKGQRLGTVRRDLPEALLLGIVFAFDEACDRWLVENSERLTLEEMEETAVRLLHALRRSLEPPRRRKR